MKVEANVAKYLILQVVCVLGSRSFSLTVFSMLLYCALHSNPPAPIRIHTHTHTHTHLRLGENDIDQLACVFRVLGTPTAESWPGVEDLPDFNKVRADIEGNPFLQSHSRCNCSRREHISAV